MSVVQQGSPKWIKTEEARHRHPVIAWTSMRKPFYQLDVAVVAQSRLHKAALPSPKQLVLRDACAFDH